MLNDKGKEINVGSVYDEAYFLRGKETCKSCYENYRWMPELTVPMVQAMVCYLGIGQQEDILDFGCARGYTVRAFCEQGYNAWGYDVSEWALTNADETIKDRLIVNDSVLIEKTFDWVISKDVLEHVPQVADTINDLLQIARTGVFVVVPLSAADGEKYVVRSYEKDVTHIHRLSLTSWVRMFLRPGWTVTACYRVPGVKDNYARFAEGNGFITCRRIEE